MLIPTVASKFCIDFACAQIFSGRSINMKSAVMTSYQGYRSATVTKQSPLIRVLTLRYLLLGLLYDFIDICTVTRNTHFQIARTPETSESWPCHLSASNYIIRDKGSRYCSSGANSVCVTNALCQVLHLSLLTLLLFSAFVLHL